MEWFRFYHGVVDDPKIMHLPVHLRWSWVEIMCLSSREKIRGRVPPIDVLAFHMRKTVNAVKKILAELTMAGLIDELDDGQCLMVHAWEKRQPRSDDVKARVDRHRNKETNGDCNVTETLHETELKPLARARTPSVSVSVLNSEEGSAEGNQEPGPEFTALGNLAIDLSADWSIGPWVSRMARLGYTTEMIRYAIEQGAASGQWARQWLHAILKRVQLDGIPAPPRGKGEPVQMPAKPKREVTPEEQEQARASYLKRLNY